MSRYLLIDKYGAVLSAREGRFQVRVKERDRWRTVVDASPPELDSIIIATPSVSVTAAAMALAARHGIDLVIMDWRGPVARLLSADYGSTIWVWVEQLKQREDPARRAELAAAFVEGKVRNQAAIIRMYRKVLQSGGRRAAAANLRRAYDELIALARDVRKVRTWEEAAQLEARAARTYWGALRNVIPKELGFTKRLKRYDLPPGQEPDPFNKALNIGYGILAKEVWRAIFAAGLNPYISYLHEKRPGRKGLIYDLMEEFRPPAVDRPLIKLARKDPQTIKKLNHQNQETAKQAAKQIAKTIITNIRETKPPLKNTILTQARKLAKAIKEHTNYTPYTLKY